MDSERIVLVHDDKDAIVEAVSLRFFRTVSRVLEQKSTVHIALTGGTIGIAVLAAIGIAPWRDTLDWNRIHVWWGDERWLPRTDPERNDTQADDALLSRLTIAATNIHRFPTSDDGLSLDAAAISYASLLQEYAEHGQQLPHFDLVFLGVGPDGHIASLFPEREGIRVTSSTVVSVRNSPKPPPERLSLTLPSINSADRVWLALAGSDKAPALGLALAGASAYEVPAAGAEARGRTVFFIDQAAAAEVPSELIASEY